MQPTELSSSSSSFSEDEDERRQSTLECAVLVITSVAAANAAHVVPTRGGSLPEKAGNRDTGIEQGVKQIDRDYFDRLSRLPAPIADEDFERRFRMPRSVYERLREGLLETDRYFIQKRDAVGKIGASTDQKMVCDLRQLAYGIPADAVCEYVRVSESTASESLHRFCAAVRRRLQAEYLGRPNCEGSWCEGLWAMRQPL